MDAVLEIVAAVRELPEAGDRDGGPARGEGERHEAAATGVVREIHRDRQQRA